MDSIGSDCWNIINEYKLEMERLEFIKNTNLFTIFLNLIECSEFEKLLFIYDNSDKIYKFVNYDYFIELYDKYNKHTRYKLERMKLGF